MCDEEQVTAKLTRNHGEELTTNLTRDIEAFFRHKFGTLSTCHFRRMVVGKDDMAQVDFTVSRGDEGTRRYVGNAGYIDGHLTLGQVIRLM